MSETSDKPRRSPWLLRRADQATVAFLVVIGLASSVGWWLAQGGWQGRLVEVERAGLRTARFEVDVNGAQWPELLQLPGVGEVLAKRIVQYRQEHGPFKDLDDLRNVKGIGPKTFETIHPFLRPMPSRSATAGP
jgi:competence protein ComEA